MDVRAFASMECLLEKLKPIKKCSTYKAAQPPKTMPEKERTLKRETFVSARVRRHALGS
jgi:16S rRNA G527 N7-methylase RsmG